MLRLLTDENLHGGLIQAILRRCPEIDLLRAIDAGLEGFPDPQLLEWAAADDRILFSNDRRTMIGHAYDRINAGFVMPGIFILKAKSPSSITIEDISIVLQCSTPDEWRDKVTYFPL